MKKRSINGNHINMIKGRLGGEGIDSDAALWPAMSTSNMLMNRAAKTEVGWVDRGHMKGEELTLKQQEVVWEQVGGTLVSCSSGCHISRVSQHYFWIVFLKMTFRRGDTIGG